MKVKMDPEAVYASEGSAPWKVLQDTLALAEGTVDEDTAAAAEGLKGVVWTTALQRMFCLVNRCAD